MITHKKIILDASAFIALIDQESGWEAVENIINNSVMSVVNVSEVAKFLINNKDYTKEEAKNIVESLINDIIVFNTEQAYITADLYAHNKEHGLSFGDRACVALALVTGYPVYTADEIWAKAKVDNVDIKLIR